jgi:hypothetical protein
MYFHKKIFYKQILSVVSGHHRDLSLAAASAAATAFASTTTAVV